ncbi:MAG: hypothetical protein AABX31_00980 [Nanoarchaeota archaeon]
MVIVQEHPISLIKGNTIKQGTAKSFYDQHCYIALHKAQEYGDVLTMPEFLQVLYLSSFQSSLLDVPFTVQTEEIFGKSKQGNDIAMVVHGKGLLTPKRIRDGIKIGEIVEDEIPNHGLTRTKSGRGQFALPLYDSEVHDLLEGLIVPVFLYSEFKALSNLPLHYAVVRDFHPRKEIPSGHNQYLSTLMVTPRVISLAGGVENLEHCFEVLTFHHGLQKMRYSHPLHDLDPEQPQGRFIEVHGIGNFFYSHREMDGPARFLAVKREHLEEKIDKEVMIEVL